MGSGEVGVTRAKVQLLVLSLCLPVVTAYAGEGFPGQAPDREIIRTQEKVDSLVERGKYDRAMFIYRHELAPLGDKYAQYMIGFMYLAGKGVEADPAIAAAWYRLAAERTQETYVNEHAKLYSLLDDGQRRRADGVYQKLRSELGDTAFLAKLVEADLQILRGRIKEIPFSQDTISRSNFARRQTLDEQTVKQIRSRMAYLEEKLQTDAGVSAIERQRFQDLAARAESAIEEFESSR